MKRLALLAFVVLAGCSDRPRWMKPSEVSDIAADEAADAVARSNGELSERIDRLERDNEALRRRIDAIDGLANAVADQAANTARVVNHNADAADERERQRRTAAGECGLETTPEELPNGGRIWRNRQCP